MTDRFTITREIGIDAGHRVMTHGSKCRNLHGHRYRIEVTCSAPILAGEGEQSGMVLDFGFLKGIMMDVIDAKCDHGMIMYVDDPFLVDHFGFTETQLDTIKATLRAAGSYSCEANMGKMCIVPFIPTAEHLAKHWFEQLKSLVIVKSDNLATLDSVIVHETPNCKAEYYEQS